MNTDNCIINKFSIFDLNIVLIFVGYAVVSTLIPNINSAIVSLAFSLVSLICLFRSGVKIKTIFKVGDVYLIMIILILLRTTLDLYIGSLSYVTASMKIYVMVYGYGVVLIPLLSVMSSYEKINWRLSLLVIFLLLFIVVGYGVATSSMERHIMVNGRIRMNDKLGSIAFAEKASYLMMLSLVHLVFPPFNRRFLKNAVKVLSILGLVLAFYGFGRAASRGPFLAAFAVVIFFLYNNSKHFKTWVFVSLIIVLLGSATLLSSFEKFAPLLYERIESTLEEGDEGRTMLTDEGIEMLKASPIIGDNPLIIWNGGFTGRHNVFIDIALFLGIFGLIVYVVLVLKLLFRIKNFKRSDPVSLFFYMIFISCMVRSVTSFTLLKDAIFSIMFVMTRVYAELEYNRNRLK